MPQHDPIPTSIAADHKLPTRDEIVKIVSDFYHFLATFPYFEVSYIKVPPAGGWPEEMCDSFRKLGKTAEVVDLLKHLPYLTIDRDMEILNETRALNYSSPRLLKKMDKDGDDYRINPKHEKIPSHVVSLTTGNNYGLYLLLNMQTGNVTEYSLLGQSQPTFTDKELESGDNWKRYPTQPITEYFATKTQKYRSLQEIPVVTSEDNGGCIWPRGGAKQDQEILELQKIYYDHGWLSEDFRREDCKVEVLRWYANSIAATAALNRYAMQKSE